MPIYEYYCRETHKIYCFLARRVSEAGMVPRCPDGEGLSMERKVSRFAVVRGGGAEGGEEQEGGDPFAGMDERALAGLAAELEEGMGGLDEVDPDPRQLGRVLAKMRDALGDKMPPAMGELIARLEKGEDPEQLEDEFGGLIDDDEAFLGGARRALSEALRRPVRDPKLYELREWV